MLTIAIQKNGRLSEKTISLLLEAGVDFKGREASRLKAESSNFPAEIILLRDDDIPECVSEGIADAGILGENILVEKNKPVRLEERLGYARCRLSIAIPRNREYRSVRDLEGLEIATSYPSILSGYLRREGVSASIRQISGSAEIIPQAGVSDAIFDVVNTGKTLVSHGLKEVEKVLRSEAVLIAGRKLSEAKEEILDELTFRIRAVIKSRNYRYILLNAPDDAVDRITAILPGMKSPTVMPLALEGWSSIHTVIRENEFWNIIQSLKKSGAQGILVVPIEKMVV